jgi:cytochrome P450
MQPENILDPSQLFSPKILANPYPIYHQLRSAAPVYQYHARGRWILTRYADVVAALRDPRLAVDRVIPLNKLKERGLEQLSPLFSTLSNMMLFSDPPKHTRLRALVNQAFTTRVVESLRNHIQEITNQFLDTVQDTGRMDVIQHLAYPLPTIVIAEMLGVPIEDRDRFRKWSDDCAALIGNIYPTPEQCWPAMQSIFELKEYFSGILAELRSHRRENLMSALATAGEHGDRLSEEELFANCVLLLAAGNETTANLIGNGILALLRNPAQIQQLKDDPSLIVSAVEELLRYDSPVQFTGRLASEELELSGNRIGKGHLVVLALGAANRDPAQFAEPDRLDIRRRENRHIAFSHGAHFCLGASLARLEAQIAISTMIKRLPDLRLETEELTWREFFSLRGLVSLPVVF